MDLACVQTRGEFGLLAPPVTVEVHLSGGLPGLSIVGLAETAVKESRERVRAAIGQCGFNFPNQKITVNLAPADLPKSGGRFDLAIAVGVLGASGQIPVTGLGQYEFLGELAFSGAVRSLTGLLPALLAIRSAARRAVVPAANAAEAGLLGTETVLVTDHLVRVVRHLQGIESLKPTPPLPDGGAPSPGPEDLHDVQGHQHAKRALEIAAAGGHNVLLIGPPGTGKSMLARRLPGLLPPLPVAAAVETAALYSIIGIPPARHWRRRPFRAPHHTASAPALVGGGSNPRPGEISLAHNGVLFLDELPEFSRPVLEALREPLQTGRITVARARRSVEYPADFQLVGAMNPCVCGFHGDPQHPCRCSPDQVRRYQERLSGPFLDRIDIRVQVGRSEFRLHQPPAGESSTEVGARVAAAQALQLARAGGSNARLASTEVRRWCLPDADGARLLERAAGRLQLSRRACDSVLRVARTISDLAGSDPVSGAHICEALTLRRPLGAGT